MGTFPLRDDQQDFERDFIGEQSAAPSPGDTSGGRVWFTYSSPEDLIDLKALFSWPYYCFAYAFLYIHSPVEQPAKLWIGSDDGIRVWWNGELMRSHHIHRAYDKDQEVVFLTLNEGWNRLLLKIEQVSYTWGFYARLCDLENQEIADLSYSLNLSVVEKQTEEVPLAFQLLPNYPNPFNIGTMISYHLTGPSQRTVLSIYNLWGQEVRTLVDAFQGEGEYRVYWDGRDDKGCPLPSGVYFSRLKSGRLTHLRKMVLIR